MKLLSANQKKWCSVTCQIPKMKFFSQGLLATPKLERVEVADDEGHWKDDLDTTIQQLFIKAYGSF